MGQGQRQGQRRQLATAERNRNIKKGHQGTSVSPTSGSPTGGKEFSGECSHCRKSGHMKWHRLELDKMMNEKRAAAAAAGKGAGAKGGHQRSAMELGNECFLQPQAPGTAPTTAAAPRGLWLLEAAPQLPELPLIGNRFREL